MKMDSFPGKTPELLAPAGDLLTALTAFDAGADAVYCGLKKFNARERSGNFSGEEMGKLVRYAHSVGKKVYVTFNTIIKEGEITEAIETLAFLDGIRPDALILQDLGMIHIAREYFPRLTLHGSTQMALHNSDDLIAAKALGLSRVILERQTTLEELEEMAGKTPLELELFIHGALCCCLSGTCLFSSYVTGGSGNRGRCRQLCRQKFRLPGEKEGKFYFSTGDLMGAEFIPLFRKWGIASLKIEGRLRKPDYAGKVTAAYRMLLDAKGEKEFQEVWKEANALFERLPSREYTGGFYTESSAKKVIRSNSPPGLGIPAGRVLKVTAGHIEAELTARLHLGDDVRIQKEDGSPGESFRLLSLACNGKKVLKAFRGQKVTFPRPPEKNIPPGGVLFRTGESYDRMEKRIEALPDHLPEEDLFLTLSRNELTVTAGSFPEKCCHIPLSLSPAREHPLQKETLERELDLSASNDIPILTGKIRAEIKENCFLPKSLCRELRRELKKFLRTLPAEELPLISRERGRKALEEWERSRSPLAGKILEETDLSHDFPLPVFLPEKALAGNHALWDDAVKKGMKEFRVTSIGALHHLHKKDPSLSLTVTAPLPVANSFAVKELSALGAERVFIHLELGKEDMELLAEKAPIPLLLWKKIRPVLLATRATLGITGPLLAASGEKFLVEKEGGLFLLKPAAIVHFPPLPGVFPAADFRVKEEKEGEDTGSSGFNFDRGLG